MDVVLSGYWMDVVLYGLLLDGRRSVGVVLCSTE